MNIKHILVALAVAGSWPIAATAQTTTTYAENFTGTGTINSWYFKNGACLTAGSSSSTTNPGTIPACVGLPYYSGVTLKGGNTGTLPDSPSLGGALRFTQTFNETGAILSAFSFPLSSQGLQVTFTTETYEGNSGGTGADGADGMSFFLQDALQVADVGAYGGSLAYTCSNSNPSGTLRPSGQPYGYDGLIGGYVGLGIDEYGNYLNASDNTSSGYGYVPNRIGMRGAGSTAWSYLTATYPTQYPSSLTYAQRAAAVQLSCSTGYVWDYSNLLVPFKTTTKLANYAVIPNAYKVLSGVKIANESATMRGDGSITTSAYGVPITYNLTITTAGLLSLSYSYNGGAYTSVISGQNITTSNGVLPANVRFGFAGSTGGSDNIHEIMCFQATPQTTTESSAGLNQKQAAKVQTGTQVYLAFYNPRTWAGSLTSQYLDASPSDPSQLQVDPAVNWDAACVLTGVPSGSTCSTTGGGAMNATAPASRVIMSYDGSTGVPFEWSSPGISAAEKTALNTGDSTSTSNRLSYLRGDRTNEVTASGSGTFRARASVLGDIIDSSPTYVGPPSAGYPALWADKLYSSSTPAENAGPTYAAFTTSNQTRTNVVYTGANDGMMHAFRTGHFDASGAYVSTYNDGSEMMAYVPAYVVNNINISSDSTLDYTNPQYGHRFEVDATPAKGDLYYGGAWHTWLVGGMGPGGAAMYALDITNPGSTGANNYTEASASSTVIGEWSTTSTTSGTTTTTTSTLPCVADTSSSKCGVNLGNTYGTPEIARFHNGSWGVVFGNGFGSSTGDAGIYIMLVNPTSGAKTFYYLSTGTAAAGSTGNGIAYATSVDLDGDLVIDYIYAGDLLGNVWRFDVTSSNPASWAVTPNAIYKTNSGQPITTKVVAASIASTNYNRVLIEFGTGQQVPLTNASAASYKTSQQFLYGIWDWNMAAWNSLSSVHYAAMPSGTLTAPTQPSAPGAALTGTSNLQVQTITGSYNSSLSSDSANGYYRTVSNTAICWADTTGCNKYGWYLGLTYGHANPTNANDPNTTTNTYNATVYEQTIFSPILQLGVFIVNTAIPPSSSLATCSSTSSGGWTLFINPATGGAFTTSVVGDANNNYLNVTDSTGTSQAVSGVALSATGSGSIVNYFSTSTTANGVTTTNAGGTTTTSTATVANGTTSSTNSYFYTTQTASGAVIIHLRKQDSSGGRVTWIQKR